jgi:hypothetical protein
MSNDTDDAGVIETILQRLNTFRLPRLVELKERVDRGETISEHDHQFLERVLNDARSIKGLVKRQPAVQPLVAKLTTLYAEIVAKSLENEAKNESS